MIEQQNYNSFGSFEWTINVRNTSAKGVATSFKWGFFEETVEF